MNPKPRKTTPRAVDQELARYKQWVSDLQSKMYVNCIYCGHRYGPVQDTPVALADVLKQHIEQCPSHPMSQLKVRNAELAKMLEAALHCVRSYQFGNAAAGLAEEMGDAIEKVLRTS